jgi:hypothetical protein
MPAQLDHLILRVNDGPVSIDFDPSKNLIEIRHYGG